MPWYGGWGGWYGRPLLSDIPSDAELDRMEKELDRKEARMKDLSRRAERLKKGF